MRASVTSSRATQHVYRLPGDAVRVLGVDLGQYIGRALTTTLSEGKVVRPTILIGSVFWVSTPDEAEKHIHRPVVGVESMMLQGWPALHPPWEGLLNQYSDNSFRQSLAGNAFAGSVIMSLVASLLFAVD